ncbi:D-2-hydroxyglutarate dehydrogenase, mitochondrial [Diorhabda sublineata]|uniref:D-2-hydroxyglutarate dehydrogenase, mitochondrial n=1 Tax=Diorhabda sublineata TaxID=1163346 RepID=UPI0024E1533F|nr:D-2-hydroxyglutarate dehydrogenase, mitochondrial [Diorhabda sublineata]XP_056634625.1 D-2-hydroxyglutarate dehydrogenase, mitochondrial [Diorhabda sublineata]XP_056634626.1 D-2-hydroxyglutarate dehydrogenase, mitochondrial [Diorhabda sublineata]XP_056634627.1 D-2-hydroxyglutarate dehydrogenase, mitochondrial [Diorhabda sublineata]XP_056634628.1 D-2-hydroxyglutarate dehydrogenase, mitochondrial [Diorhabda sublineata]XP_056634629.1 D-2-hydroxyglutarate dehydrogenase, mitochondrial [Diorhabda
MFLKGVRQLIGPLTQSPGRRPFPARPSLERPFQFSRQLASASTLPQLTKDRYPYVKRGQYANLDQHHLKYFKDLLGPNRVITDTDECQGFNIDWIRSVRGYSQCVLKPKTTEEVSSILSFCNENRLAVCPQGGNTGLVAGSVPVFDEVVLWTGLMNEIIHLDDTSGVLTCQAGCILENLENYVANHDLMIPLDLGAKGSCYIGGNVSTNAGGLRLLRYGNLHGSILGIEAVKADGEVIDCLNTLKKDNTGYHLKHLFIGSEGTLGVVTKVAISCPTKPKAINVALLGLNSFEEVLRTLKKAKRELGEILSSCELIDNLCMDLVLKHLKVPPPIGQHNFYMLIETHGSNLIHDEEKTNSFLENVMNEGLALDGTTTNEVSKMKSIWDLRERITEALLHDGYIFKYDISLPTESFYSLVEIMKERLGDRSHRVCGYGHLGDGNIHLSISVSEFTKEILDLIEPYVYEVTSKFKGSVSAEHGIGFRKPKYMHYSKSKEAIMLMKHIKNLMDPNGILNPYKVLPP